MNRKRVNTRVILARQFFIQVRHNLPMGGRPVESVLGPLVLLLLVLPSGSGPPLREYAAS